MSKPQSHGRGMFDNLRRDFEVLWFASHQGNAFPT
jgi:hypothetical protein